VNERLGTGIKREEKRITVKYIPMHHHKAVILIILHEAEIQFLT
jgi:hypothetical protein